MVGVSHGFEICDNLNNDLSNNFLFFPELSASISMNYYVNLIDKGIQL